MSPDRVLVHNPQPLLSCHLLHIFKFPVPTFSPASYCTEVILIKISTEGTFIAGVLYGQLLALSCFRSISGCLFVVTLIVIVVSSDGTLTQGPLSCLTITFHALLCQVRNMVFKRGLQFQFHNWKVHSFS